MKINESIIIIFGFLLRFSCKVYIYSSIFDCIVLRNLSNQVFLVSLMISAPTLSHVL